jgi:glucose-6-phosphate-specific signal transduction histidine kinase
VTDSRIRLCVTDDDVGFFVVSPKQGYGLTGIRERGLGLPPARAIIKEVATATVKWRDVAQKPGARSNTMIVG